MTFEFFAGRNASVVSVPFQDKDKFFAAERLDGDSLDQPLYAHCTFANVSFKGATIEGGEFENCVFISCYFRKSILKEVTFSGCKFINCAFPSVIIAECSFRFPVFRGSFIEFERIENSLPEAPYERYLLTANMEAEARQAGDINEARLYRLESLNAWENHLLAAVKGVEGYYQEHFPTTGQRAHQLWRYVRSKVNGAAWGYGERGWALLRNFVLMTLVIFPLLFLVLRNDFFIQGNPPRTAHAEEYILMSLGNVLPGAWAPEIVGPSVAVQGLRAAESLLGILVAGMLVSLLLKAVARR